MSQEDAPAAETPATETPGDDAKPQDGEAKTFDKQYVSELRSEAANWRIKAQQAAEKLEEYEEANKSELEKAQGKASKAEQRAASAENQLLRLEVAIQKELPSQFVSRLQGATREELEADADTLLELVQSRSESKPDFDGGAREPAPNTDPNAAHQDAILKVLGLTAQ